MVKPQVSAPLRTFFVEELKNDSNATLETVRWHLRDLSERGPDEPAAAHLDSLLAETEAMIATEHEHALVSQFV